MTEIRLWIVAWDFGDGFIVTFPIFGKSLPSHKDIVAEKEKGWPKSGGGSYQMEGPFVVPCEEKPS